MGMPSYYLKEFLVDELLTIPLRSPMMEVELLVVRCGGG